MALAARTFWRPRFAIAQLRCEVSAGRFERRRPIVQPGKNLGKSVIHPPGLGEPYLLKPVLRLVNNLEVGTLDGTVAPGLIVEGCVPAVYLYTGADVVPDDIGSATPPLATTAVNLDNTTGAYRFRLGFVPTGTHTVAFTCGADDDGAESDDAIVFSAPQNVDILAGQTTTVEFAATP